MKKKIKSYLVFTTGLYRVATFLLVPLAVLGLQILAAPTDFFLVTYITIVVLTPAEVLLDYWVFGGIAMKNGGQLEYLKTSDRGRSLIKTALTVDMARQFLAGVLLCATGGVIYLWRNGMVFPGMREFICGIDLLLLGYFFIVTELTIARHFDGLMVNLGIATIGSGFMVGGIYLIARNAYVMLGVLAILSVAMSAVGVKLVMKRVEEGYYDQTD